MSDLVSVTIDDQRLEVPKGTLLIRAAEQLGITIPRFCDHPLLDPVAACRQCLVEVEGQRKPLASCSSTCTPDMVVRTHRTSELARNAQQGQLELLLVNHPLDCPQCDKGGECPLQDQTLAHGPADSRMVDRKRVFQKPVPISPQVSLDRERCVLCARCTRFSQEIAGDPFIELFERGALEQVAIYADQPYRSYFSGNVVQICPVGALTANSYRFSARPFDLRSIPGVGYHDAGGQCIRIDVRRGAIERQLARTNMDTNEMWLDDVTRFAYAFVQSPDRLTQPAVRSAVGLLEETSWANALAVAGERLRAVLDREGGAGVGVLTGGRLVDEDAYAVSRLARDVLGTDNVDFRLAPGGPDEVALLREVAARPGLAYADVEAAGTVVVAALDPEEEAPALYLRLRKAWRKRSQRIVVVGPALGSLADIAWTWIPTPAGGEADALEALRRGDVAALQPVVDVLGGGAVVLVGERIAQSPGAIPAVTALASERDLGLAWIPRKAGARGAVEAGLYPGGLPGGRSLDDAGPVASSWGRVPAAPGLDARGVLQAAASGELGALLCFGVDPVRDFDDPELARRALEEVEFLLVADLLPTDTVHHADVILPAAAPPERVGSFTSWEGRRQAWPKAVGTAGQSLADWDIARQLARVLGVDLGWETAVDVRREAEPLMAPSGAGPVPPILAAPAAPAVPAAAAAGGAGAAPAADLPLRATVVPNLVDRGTMLQGAKELLETAKPAVVAVHPEDAAAAGVVGAAGVAVVGPFDRVELGLHVTPAVARGSVVLPLNRTEGPIGALFGAAAGAGAPLRVRLERADGTVRAAREA